jgi:hypothetical protein
MTTRMESRSDNRMEYRTDNRIKYRKDGFIEPLLNLGVVVYSDNWLH